MEFNDVAALEAALKPGDVACVLCEPAMTNIGMVLPEPGFHDALRSLTRKHGTLLVIDETHSISTGPGGYTRAHKLEPDFFVLGKPIAGGIPSAVYGFTAEVAERMAAVAKASAGYSGMGTTLSANPLVMAAMRANLERVMTDAAYDHMLALSARLADGIARRDPGAAAALACQQCRRAGGVRLLRPAAEERHRGRGRDAAGAGACHPYVSDQSRRADRAVPQHDAGLSRIRRRRNVDHLIATVRDCCDELRAA